MHFIRSIGRWLMTALVVNSSIFGVPSELARLLGRASPLASRDGGRNTNRFDDSGLHSRGSTDDSHWVNRWPGLVLAINNRPEAARGGLVVTRQRVTRHRQIREISSRFGMPLGARNKTLGLGR